MKVKEILPYIDESYRKKVVVKLEDGKRFVGFITNTESEFDTSSGKMEIELWTGKVWYGLPIDEIVEVIQIN